MNVKHTVMNSRDMSTRDNIFQLINSMFEEADHVGIAQFRVGIVVTTALDTAIPVTFSSPLPDSDYEVFLQPNSNVSTTTYPTSLRADGFVLNLSIGVNATFSYLAVGTV